MWPLTSKQTNLSKNKSITRKEILEMSSIGEWPESNSDIFAMNVSLVDVQGRRVGEVLAAEAGVFHPVSEKMPEKFAKTVKIEAT